MAAVATAEARRDALVGRLFEATLGAFDLLGVYLGDRLGLYQVLAERGPSTSGELAEAAGINERYAREWLEQQAMCEILGVDDPGAEADERRFHLLEGHDEALLDETSLNFVAPMAQALVACTLPIHSLLEAFRTGDGVPYADYGADLHEGQARFTRPMFENLLATEWLPAVPAVHARLLGDPPARVADVACGLGRSTVSIARAYPKAHVDGIDLDAASIAAPRRSAPGQRRRGPGRLPPRGRRRSRLRGRVRPRHDLRGAARHVVPRRGAARRARRCSPTAARDRRRRADGRALLARRRPDRAPLLRLQRPPLPAGGDGR